MNPEEYTKVNDFMEISYQLPASDLIMIIQNLLCQIDNRIDNGQIKEWFAKTKEDITQ